MNELNSYLETYITSFTLSLKICKTKLYYLEYKILKRMTTTMSKQWLLRVGGRVVTAEGDRRASGVLIIFYFLT